MANLQIGSECQGGINLNTTQNYTMYKLPEGVRNDAGFDEKGSFMWDTSEKLLAVLDANGDWYQVETVNFTAL
jgi:hypothetical protein